MLGVVDDLDRGRRLANEELKPELGKIDYRSEETSKRKILRPAIRTIEVMDRDLANCEAARLDLFDHFNADGSAIGP